MYFIISASPLILPKGSGFPGAQASNVKLSKQITDFESFKLLNKADFPLPSVNLQTQ